MRVETLPGREGVVLVDLLHLGPRLVLAPAHEVGPVTAGQGRDR